MCLPLLVSVFETGANDRSQETESMAANDFESVISAAQFMSVAEPVRSCVPLPGKRAEAEQIVLK